MKKFIAAAFTIAFYSFATAQPINFPHQSNHTAKTIHSTFTEAPKTLDPARAYSANEIQIIAQIIESPLQYDYIKRPL